MSKKPFTYDQFKEIYSLVPRLCVDLVIPYDGGIALIERAADSYKGQWHLPGGTVYFQETLEHAAQRIAKEEVGIEVSVDKLLGYIEYHSEKKERGFGYTVANVFLCTITGGSIKLDDTGSTIKGFSLIPSNTIVDQRNFLIDKNIL